MKTALLICNKLGTESFRRLNSKPLEREGWRIDNMHYTRLQPRRFRHYDMILLDHDVPEEVLNDILLDAGDTPVYLAPATAAQTSLLAAGEEQPLALSSAA